MPGARPLTALRTLAVAAALPLLLAARGYGSEATPGSRAEHAVRAGPPEKPRLKGIDGLAPLNKVLRAGGEDEVDDAGLGVE